ncbi:jg19415 [Pararge aegeria aegeria]|uniref:Jg19415 protein n=1 Tax=Pararge aegeria aegeria TaxID=348720 RepID=A0A8S4R8C7_9NEOP|nr:jg19415 [Pararge aegeria aegeria]
MAITIFVNSPGDCIHTSITPLRPGHIIETLVQKRNKHGDCTSPDELCHKNLYYYCAHSLKYRWTLGSKVLKWQPRFCKRSVGRPQPGEQTTSNVSRRAASKQAAQNRGVWNPLQKTYVQQWTSIS